MEQHQFVNVTSPWNVQGPYDINCILQIHQQDESSELPLASTHSIKLVPPPSTNDSDEGTTPSCQLVLTCRPCIAVTSIEIISNARHVELYDNLDSYCCTVRGERLEDGGADQQTGLVSYLANLTAEGPLPLCRLKFLSLTDKCQLALSRLRVTTTRTEGESYRMTGSRSIDMTKVRDIMSTLQQPIPDNVQSLMQTVEQYQKNQASVLEDFQQAATARLTSSGDSKASLASNMAGVLNAFSKATALQQQMARTQTTGNPAVPGAAPADSRNPPQPSDGSPATARPPSMDTLAKLMTSFGMGGAEPGAKATEGGALSENPDMLSALRAMCRDVSHMRAADREAAERSYGPERRGDREECSTTHENARQVDKSPHRNGMVELEQRLMGYIAASEKRIMGRLDQQMEQLRDHVDLRFNKLESLLEGSGRNSPVNVDTGVELVTEELD
ncbi:uncharacterized protein LOC119720657 isoform X2 [Patiria miniata]|nr:uncharacterized protein LOC119720657 isoform X2 [Patiria miniata]XP_038046373.1 uncharacterized protein LOC119720657 isoform X2 [Patiria miniata]